MARDFKDEFEEWATRGPGEAMLGGALKAAGKKERNRIRRKLETPNLFPHIEHEDRHDLKKAEDAIRRGDKMVKRCRARKQAINAILDADAGLRITADDLASTPNPDGRGR